MRMINYSDFVDKWKSLPHQKNNVYLALNIEHPLKIQMGYHTNGQKSLVIMDVGEVENIPSSYAINATNPKLANGSYALEFQLILKSLEDIFLRLCWDMIDYSSQSAQPLKDLINRYLSWQKLLKQLSKKELSFESQKGLLGELLYLEELSKQVGLHEAVDCWLGPDGSDQDFVFSNGWTEVKTIAASAETIRISSLEQLNHTQTGILMVYMLEKTLPGADRITLNEVVDSFRERLRSEPITKDRFELKLYKYGYRDEEREAYAKNWFRLIKQLSYNVDENFPKLTSENIPIEIVRCTYHISIASIEPFRR